MGAADEKWPRYHQNPDGIGFLFKFDHFSYQHWEVRGLSPTLGGSGLPKRYKVTPLLLSFYALISLVYRHENKAAPKIIISLSLTSLKVTPMPVSPICLLLVLCLYRSIGGRYRSPDNRLSIEQFPPRFSRPGEFRGSDLSAGRLAPRDQTMDDRQINLPGKFAFDAPAFPSTFAAATHLSAW